MSPTEFSNYIKQRAMQKSLQQQTGQQYQQNGFQDKFYSQNSCYSANNSNNPNMNFNNFPKSLTSPGGNGSNDYNFGFGGLNNSHSFNNQSAGINLSDYSSLLSEFSSEVDLDTNAFLQDILSSAGVGPIQKSANSGRQLPGYDDWLNSGVGLGFNANQLSDVGLGPDSRSSSTKSMSSGSDSLPSPANQANDGFNSQRVLVAN